MLTDKDYLLALQLERRLGRFVAPSDARTLRLAGLTLHRWAELECGDSNDYASWAIERDENGEGPPYMVRHQHIRVNGSPSVAVSRTRIPDREKGALKRVANTCARLGLFFFHQTDPRGCALYVSDEPLDQSNYTRGVGV